MNFEIWSEIFLDIADAQMMVWRDPSAFNFLCNQISTLVREMHLQKRSCQELLCNLLSLTWLLCLDFGRTVGLSDSSILFGLSWVNIHWGINLWWLTRHNIRDVSHVFAAFLTTYLGQDSRQGFVLPIPLLKLCVFLQE